MSKETLLIIIAILPIYAGSIIFHEIGHVLILWLSHVRKFAILVQGTLLMKFSDLRKITCKHLSGGITIIPFCRKYVPPEKLARIIQISLIAGPFFSTVIIVISCLYLRECIVCDNIVKAPVFAAIALINLNILLTCFMNDGDMVGDVRAFFLFQKKRPLLLLHVLEMMCVTPWVFSQADFLKILRDIGNVGEFSEAEKRDYAFNCVNLCLLGKIKTVPKQLHDEIQMEFALDSCDYVDIIMQIRFLQYRLFVKNISQKYFSEKLIRMRHFAKSDLAKSVIEHYRTNSGKALDICHEFYEEDARLALYTMSGIEGEVNKKLIGEDDEQSI